MRPAIPFEKDNPLNQNSQNLALSLKQQNKIKNIKNTHKKKWYITLT